MILPRGNSEFCFQETLNVSARGDIEVKGKQNSLLPVRPVIKCFVIPPNSKLKRNCEEIISFMLAGSQIYRFQGAPPDHVRVESSRYYFPRKLVSFVRLRHN